jgi:hypothetical protein
MLNSAWHQCTKHIVLNCSCLSLFGSFFFIYLKKYCLQWSDVNNFEGIKEMDRVQIFKLPKTNEVNTVLLGR